MAAATIALNNKNRRTHSHADPLLVRAASGGTQKLPPEEEWIKSGTLEKRAFASVAEYHLRRVVLTKDVLAVTRIDSTDVIDQVFLTEVESTKVSLQQGIADIEAAAAPRSPMQTSSGSGRRL